MEAGNVPVLTAACRAAVASAFWQMFKRTLRSAILEDRPVSSCETSRLHKDRLGLCGFSSSGQGTRTRHSRLDAQRDHLVFVSHLGGCLRACECICEPRHVHGYVRTGDSGDALNPPVVRGCKLVSLFGEPNGFLVAASLRDGRRKHRDGSRGVKPLTFAVVLLYKVS